MFGELDSNIKDKFSESGKVVVLEVSTSGIVALVVGIKYLLFESPLEEVKITTNGVLLDTVLNGEVVVLSV